MKSQSSWVHAFKAERERHLDEEAKGVGENTWKNPILEELVTFLLLTQFRVILPDNSASVSFLHGLSLI